MLLMDSSGSDLEKGAAGTEVTRRHKKFLSSVTYIYEIPRHNDHDRKFMRKKHEIHAYPYGR